MEPGWISLAAADEKHAQARSLVAALFWIRQGGSGHRNHDDRQIHPGQTHLGLIGRVAKYGICNVRSDCAAIGCMRPAAHRRENPFQPLDPFAPSMNNGDAQESAVPKAVGSMQS